MQSPKLITVLLCVLSCVLLSIPVVRGANIVLSNDDGWAEMNIRAFYDSLTADGQSVVLSAPAQDMSGDGIPGRTADLLWNQVDHVHPGKFRHKPCQFNSCPKHSPGVGSDPSNDRLNYVNHHSSIAMHYGIDQLAPKFFGGPPDLAVAGFNLGRNHGEAVLVSGTESAIMVATNLGIPGIAISGQSGAHPHAWNDPDVPDYLSTYAALSTKITRAVLDSGYPYLPDGIWLNVNFVAFSDECPSPESFQFVLSRMHHTFRNKDLDWCGTKKLPTEQHVTKHTKGCWASVTIAKGTQDAHRGEQQAVVDKLKDVLPLVCLP